MRFYYSTSPKLKESSKRTLYLVFPHDYVHLEKYASGNIEEKKSTKELRDNIDSIRHWDIFNNHSNLDGYVLGAEYAVRNKPIDVGDEYSQNHLETIG